MNESMNQVRPEPTLMQRVRNIHLVGVGGSGMSGIAEVLANLGFSVTGSDINRGEVVARLESLGVQVKIGHAPENVERADVVVVSGAIGADNPELIAARQARTPVVSRAEMLGELMRFRHGIAVAGTHGKTTTTSLLASLLADGKMDPTFIIGGLVNAFGSHARLGQGRYLVAEADESDGSFLLLQPVVSVVTNIDRDHLNAYDGSFDELQKAFLEFLHHLPFYGLAVLCIDDPHVAELVPEVGRPVLTYGLDERADVHARKVRQEGGQMHFELYLPDAKTGRPVTLNLPGIHNVQNALGAATVAWELGVDVDTIARSLESFAGIGRRFSELGRREIGGRSVRLVEDYGHHPTELDAVLSAARAGWPASRLVVVFQPHRFSRTRDLFDAFVRVLSEPDVLVLMDIYPAGETPLVGIDSPALARAIVQKGGPAPVLVSGVEDVEAALSGLVEDDDLVLLMGAGDVGRLGGQLGNPEGAR